MPRRDESCSMLESIEMNPFRRFLTGEPFSIQSSSPMDLQNLNAQSFQNVFTRIFNSLKRDPNDSSSGFLDKRDHLNESLCEDDDTPSSSGCSSASSTSGGDDNAIMADGEAKDSADEKNDLNENKEDDYVDDFNDCFPNDILDNLPDGLREVIVQIRETTNGDIRQRNKASRITMMLMGEENRNRRKAELRAKMLGLKPPPPIVPNGQLNMSMNHSHHPCVDIGGLTKPLKFPWELKKKFASPSLANHWSNKNGGAPQPQTNSNVLVIDNTNVTLRKKGTSQINEDDNSTAITRMEEEQSTAEQQVSDESGDGAVDELKEFNTHNYWYISPSSIDIEKELFILQCNAPVDFVRMYKKDSQRLIDRDMFDIPPANDVNDNVHKQKLDKLKANCVGPDEDPLNSYFAQSIVPPYLIEYFVSMEHFADSDFNMYCVYNYPAVVLTLKEE